jgi:predicted  nucleic acid-binding Zn ribbon protein
MFRAIYQTDKGDTVAVADPRLEAYKYMAHVYNDLGRRYQLATDGERFTVAADGLATLTFEKATTCPICGSEEWYENKSDCFVWWECDTCGHKIVVQPA